MSWLFILSLSPASATFKNEQKNVFIFVMLLFILVFLFPKLHCFLSILITKDRLKSGN